MHNECFSDEQSVKDSAPDGSVKIPDFKGLLDNNKLCFVVSKGAEISGCKK